MSPTRSASPCSPNWPLTKGGTGNRHQQPEIGLRLMSAFHPKQTLESPVLQPAACAPDWPMSNRKSHPAEPPRIRRDGWTNSRRVTFFVTLAATGSVTFASASVGMSRKSAYALRKRDATFASLWQRAIALRRATTPARHAEGNRNPPAVAPAAPSTGINLAAARSERDLFFAGLQKRLSGASLRPRIGKALANR